MVVIARAPRIAVVAIAVVVTAVAAMLASVAMAIATVARVVTVVAMAVVTVVAMAVVMVVATVVAVAATVVARVRPRPKLPPKAKLLLRLRLPRKLRLPAPDRNAKSHRLVRCYGSVPARELHRTPLVDVNRAIENGRQSRTSNLRSGFFCCMMTDHP